MKHIFELRMKDQIEQRSSQLLRNLSTRAVFFFFFFFFFGSLVVLLRVSVKKPLYYLITLNLQRIRTYHNVL